MRIMKLRPLCSTALLLSLTGALYLQTAAQPPAPQPPVAGGAGNNLLPSDSIIGRAADGAQRLLLSPLERDAEVHKAGWRLDKLAIEAAAAGIGAKVGHDALLLRGDAAVADAKGDFTIWQEVPGQSRALGLWVHLAADSNVDRLGFQLVDSEGESLLALVPAAWTEWKWVEFDLSTATLAQAYEQKDKNGKLDAPIKSVHVAWFAKAPGRSSLAVDGLVAATTLAAAPQLPVQAAFAGTTAGEPGAAFFNQLVLTNLSATPATAQVEYSIQRQGALLTPTPPHSIHGSDHALGALSWTEQDGQKIETGSLTDDKDWTSAKLPYKKDAYTEVQQFLDLGRERRITHLSYGPGDANWVRKLDIATSSDGKTYQPVPQLQGIDMYKKWGSQQIVVPQPFTARYLRLRYHNDGAKSDAIAMPSSFSVYDGVADEKWDLPAVGETIASGTRRATIDARTFDVLSLGSDKALSPGAYLLAVKVRTGTQTQLLLRDLFVMPSAMAAISANSRFGLNTAEVSYAPLHRRLGIGWVRFENMKWPMMSPQPDVYKFDGSVGPWHVNHDAIVESYRAQGIHVLPFLFQTPEYASSAPTDIESHRRMSYPPKDNAQMGDFVFQTVARYGSRKHPAAQLKSPDKKTGLDAINVYEIWNEPNLQAPSWGPWVGTDAQFMEMFRPAAEAVKRADPTARVTNGGYAGIGVETVDKLRTHTYADGKKPLDFVDVLNVHYYSGQTAPEIATVDTNVDRSGSKEGARTYEDELRRLSAWRARYKPGMPIWLTETGYDTAGPYGIPEPLQAARLPRVIMMALAEGIEKVMVYREGGSTPSQHAASGLLRNDGSQKPSWFSYATLIRELDGATDGRRLPHPDPQVRLYSWKRGNETLLSAWTVEGTAKLNLNLGRSTVTDTFGHRAPADVNSNFALSEFPVHIRGMVNRAPVDALQEQARQAQLQRRQEMARLAKLRAYLFDFGSRDNVGSLELGETRPFTSVVAQDRFDDARGFGFLPEGLRDNDAAWVSDMLERDSTRMYKGVQFRFRAAPGRYTLRLGVSAFVGPSTLTIRGATGGDKQLPATKDGPDVETTLEVGTAPLELEFDGYADVRWLTLVEQSTPGPSSTQ
jgi:hypothetical protein